MIDIDKLEALDKAATPGPWTYLPIRSGTMSVNRGWALRGPDTRRIFWDDTGSGCDIEGDDADIDFVLTLRNALPELLAEVRRLRKVHLAAKLLLDEPNYGWEEFMEAVDLADQGGGSEGCVVQAS